MVARVILLLCSVDLPARAAITNMKQWNGVHGCLYCEDQGVTLGSDHLHRFWPHMNSSILRSRTSLLRHAVAAARTGTAVCKCILYVHMHVQSKFVLLSTFRFVRLKAPLFYPFTPVLIRFGALWWMTCTGFFLGLLSHYCACGLTKPTETSLFSLEIRYIYVYKQECQETFKM